VFAVRVSPGGPTAAPDAPPASDNAPATPNNVTVFVRPFRFEFRLPCDMVEAFHFTPRLNIMQLYNNDGRDAAALQSLRLGQPLGLGAKAKPLCRVADKVQKPR